MRRNENGQIIFERLNLFEPILHHLNVVDNIDSYWECIYEHVRINTDLDNPITALSFCRYGRIICYDLTQETATTKTILKDDHPHLQQLRAMINNQFNAFQNCLGFCVLDGQFWINLLPATVNQIIHEDGYAETENGDFDQLVLYYQGDNPIHVSKYIHAENRYMHKIGCNTHHTTPTENILNVYQYDSIRRFVKQ